MVRDTDKHICFFFWNSLLFLLFSPTCYYICTFFLPLPRLFTSLLPVTNNIHRLYYKIKP